MHNRKQGWAAFVLLGLISLGCCLSGALIGTTKLDLSQVFESGTMAYHVFWNLRVPQVLVAYTAGAGLACCGMAFQVLFLNPLATPFTLGVAGGASWGAAMVIFLTGLSGVANGFQVSLGAFGGAALATMAVVLFSRTRMGHARHVLLLAGVAISYFFSSLLMLTMSLSDFYQTFQITRWLMGGISVAGYAEVKVLLPVVIPGLYLLGRYHRQFNLLMVGDDLAATRGMDVGRTKKRLFIIVSFLVASIVSVVGPIGFIGMVVPHVCRLLWGTDHRSLTPLCIMAGGSMLVGCDTIARQVMAPAGIPVGVVTSLIGAPFFFYLLTNPPNKPAPRPPPRGRGSMHAPG